MAKTTFMNLLSIQDKNHNDRSLWGKILEILNIDQEIQEKFFEKINR